MGAFEVHNIANDVYEHNFGWRPTQVPPLRHTPLLAKSHVAFDQTKGVKLANLYDTLAMPCRSIWRASLLRLWTGMRQTCG